jgi:hypothetical protein
VYGKCAPNSINSMTHTEQMPDITYFSDFCCVIDTIHRGLVYDMKYSRKFIGIVMIGRSINDIVH